MSDKVEFTTERAAIMAIARRLFIAKGYEQTSVNDICELVAITEVAFYRYFASKDEVLEAIWSSPCSAADLDVQPAPGDSLQQAKKRGQERTIDQPAGKESR